MQNSSTEIHKHGTGLHQAALPFGRSSRPLKLIVLDRRRAVCQIAVQAERQTDGWYVPAQFIPARVLG